MKNDFADKVVFAVCLFALIALVIQVAYQYGYDAKECKPIKTEIPLKNMTHKQQVKVIRLSLRDKGAVK